MQDNISNHAPTPARPAEAYRQALLEAHILHEGRALGLHHNAHSYALQRASALFDLTADGNLQTDSGKSVGDFLSDLRRSPDGGHLFEVEQSRPVRQARLTPLQRLDLENRRKEAQF